MWISVIVPCRNEVDHIGKFLNCVFGQELPPDSSLEVLVADGLSDDGTRDVLRTCQHEYPALTIIDNPGRIVSAGLNAALLRARGEIIIRMDVHTTYAPDYVAACRRALLESGADNVGGPWIPVGAGFVSEAIALAFASPFVSGGAKAHDPSYEGFLDTVYLGCWRKEAFARFGLFDEDLVRSQDNELNLRINRQGGKVWQTPLIRSWYTPRPSITALFQQYVQYGYWKVRVISKHKIPASGRQLVPGAFLSALLMLMLGSPFSVSLFHLLAALLAAYGCASVVAAMAISSTGRHWKLAIVLPLVFATYHFGFGFGFLSGIWDFMILRKHTSRRFRRLTRSPHPHGVPSPNR
jgi:glycosyltransferase involved in cell wall biosynthesis